MMFSRSTGGRMYPAQVRQGSLLSNPPVHSRAHKRDEEPLTFPIAQPSFQQPPRGQRGFDIEGAALLDDNSKRRRGGGVRGFVGRLLLRANWAVVSWVLRAARARWFTTLLILWAVYREFVPSARSAPSLSSDAGVAGSRKGGGASSFRASRTAPAPFPTAKDLVVVCGHAVFVGGDFSADAAALETSWYLEPYQRTPGQAAALVAHMKAGVAIANANEDSILLFSGGTTRAPAGSLSEATSYYLVSRASGFFGAGDAVAKRAFTEERARDSYENVLFSIARFRELTGEVPRRLTVVGYEFKRARFENEHLAALRWPADRFAYEGTPAASAEREKTSGEREAGVREAFARDPYGCGAELGGKRASRDPFAVVGTSHPYAATNPDLAGLFAHCGAKTYAGALPW